MNGELKKMLIEWRRLEYVDEELLKLFSCIFRYEEDRIVLNGIKECKWLNSKSCT